MSVVINQSRLKSFVIFLVFLTTLLLGSLVILDGFGLRYAIRAYIIVPFGAFLLLWIMSERIQPLIENNGFDFLYLLFCSFAFFSGVANGDVYSIISALLGCVILFLLKSLTYDSLDKAHTLFAIAYAASTLIVFCRYPISPINSEGVIFASLGIILLNILCKKKMENYVLFFLISAIIIFLIMSTTARTPLAAFCIADVISYFYLFARKFSLKKNFLLISLVVLVYFFSDYIVGSLDQYFFHKWGNADLTSGREEYWKIVMNNLSFLGYGMDKGSFIRTLGFNAHNTWIQVFGNFGIVCGFLFFALTITILLKIRLSFNRIVYFNFFIGWIVLSLFEDMSLFSSRYVPITMAFWMHLVLLSKEISIKKANNLTLRRG